MEKNFMKSLSNAQLSLYSLLTAGLDPDHALITKDGTARGNIEFVLSAYTRKIVNSVRPYASSYKLDASFYRAFGAAGVTVAIETIDYIHREARDVPVIWDAKYSGSTMANEMNRKEAFDIMNADAVTVDPYLGGDTIEPFLECKDKGIFVVCHSSNKGAGEFQERRIAVPGNGFHVALYEYAAHRIVEVWNKHGNCGLVMGATYPDEIKAVRRDAPDIPLLIPGGGEYQGGDIELALLAGMNSVKSGVLMNFSRQIMLAEDPGEEARKLRDRINQCRFKKEATA